MEPWGDEVISGLFLCECDATPCGSTDCSLYMWLGKSHAHRRLSLGGMCWLNILFLPCGHISDKRLCYGVRHGSELFFIVSFFYGSFIPVTDGVLGTALINIRSNFLYFQMNRLEQIVGCYRNRINVMYHSVLYYTILYTMILYEELWLYMTYQMSYRYSPDYIWNGSGALGFVCVCVCVFAAAVVPVVDFFAFLTTYRNANTMPIRMMNGNRIRNHATPGWPLSHRKLRKYVHTRLMNRCHSVARTCTDFAENPMVDMSDNPKYSCAGVHIWAGFFRFIWVTYILIQ